MLDKVREWLNTQGYPLEMRTASAFRQAGFEVRQSTLYRDPETGKSREVDTLAIDPDVLGILRISFVVECKATTKPWILLCSPNTLDGDNRLFAFAVTSHDARAALDAQFERLSEKLPWLRKEGMVAYSLRQAFSEKDLAYSAALSVAKATDDRVRRENGIIPRLDFAFPVIVVDSPLILCSLAENGEIHLEETDGGEFLFHVDPPKDFGTCIRVVTIGGLPAFAAEAKAVADQLRTDLKSEVDRIWNSVCPPHEEQS